MLKAIGVTGVSWFLFTGLAQVTFAFSPRAGFVLAISGPIIFIVIPTVNHVRMLFAIRRHNKVLAQHLSAVLLPEKKVAMDMTVISLVLLLSLAPMPLKKNKRGFVSKTLRYFATVGFNNGVSNLFHKPFNICAEK